MSRPSFFQLGLFTFFTAFIHFLNKFFHRPNLVENMLIFLVHSHDKTILKLLFHQGLKLCFQLLSILLVQDFQLLDNNEDLHTYFYILHNQ